MCYPCRCPRRSVSCGGNGCCPRPCCHERSRSTGNNRVVFPGEFQKFSDMIPPSFLLKQPKGRKVKKKSNFATQATKGINESDGCDKGRRDNSGDPEEQRKSGECPEMPGASGIPGQQTDMPWYGNNGLSENQMIYGMPSQPQWVCFGCPGAICVPMAPRDPVGFSAGLPAAGLPTKRSPPFNPCTGQVYQCENPQMTVGYPNETAQCPTYNQFCQGVNICFGPANPCYQLNPCSFGEGVNSNEPNRNQPYYQPYQGANMGDGNVGKATESRRGPIASQRHQYNQNTHVTNRDQAYYQFCQGLNSNPCTENPYYLHYGGDGTVGPPPGDPRSDNRAKGQRKVKETREGNVGKTTDLRKNPIAAQRHQYIQDNYGEGANNRNRGQVNLNPRQVPQQIPSSGHVSHGGKRSNSQGTRNEPREAPRSNQQNRNNSRNYREESIDRRKVLQVKQSGRVPQQNPAAGQGGSQGRNRSRSKTRGSKLMEAPRSNNQNQNNSQSLRKEPIDPRKSPRAHSPVNQVPRRTNRSKSVEPRNESRKDDSARKPQPSRSGTVYADARSKSLEKRKDSREQRSTNKPESKLRFYQQNVGMSFGPSNQDCIAECPLPDPIYTTQLESTLGDSGSPRRTYRSKSVEPRYESRRDNSARKPQPSRSRTLSPDQAPYSDGRSKTSGKRNVSTEHRSQNKPSSNSHFYHDYVTDCPLPDPIYTTQLGTTLGDSGSRRERNESQRRTSSRKNGESRKECEFSECFPGNQQTGGAPPNQPIQCYSLQFNPNNQCGPFFMSDVCCYPPCPEILGSPRGKSYDLASNDRSQLLNRTHECGLMDVQPMSTKASKKQPSTSPAKTDVCKKCNRTKPRKPTLEELLANDVTSQPQVLILDSQANEKKKKTPAEPECPEPQDQCSSDSHEVSCQTQDKVSSGESQDESGPQATADNDEEKEEKPNVDATKTAGCTNNCWMRCPIPWSCRYSPCNSPCNRPCNSLCNGLCNGPCIGPCSPCNGRFFYCGNCCNGCRRCCNYRCNPCGGYCCSRQSAGMTKCGKYPTELKNKPECGKGTHKRKKGGASVSNPSYCILPTEPTLGFPSPSTMPGYSPTVLPQYNSPYSGHWHAGEVASNPMFSNENTMKSYTRH